jgi:hypothetical protein
MASSLMSYQMITTQVTNTQHMAITMHSQAMDEQEQLNSTEVDECCAKISTCLVIGCIAIALVSANVNVNPVDYTPIKISLFLSLANSQVPTSLYRPPITT